MNILAGGMDNRGLTLIELIVSMLVISIALAGVLLATTYTSRHSADPMVRHQATAIAEAYLEEITLKSYRDPDDGSLCPAPEADRDHFDNVCDYKGLADSGAVDQNGNAIVGLENYSVFVAVSDPEVPFGPAGATVNGLKVDVTVTGPAGGSLTLSGYRAEF